MCSKMWGKKAEVKDGEIAVGGPGSERVGWWMFPLDVRRSRVQLSGAVWIIVLHTRSV